MGLMLAPTAYIYFTIRKANTLTFLSLLRPLLFLPVGTAAVLLLYRQHRETKAYYYAAPMQPMVMIPVMPQQAHPVAQQMVQLAMPRAVNVMPPPPVKENRDKENKRDSWDSFRDEKGVRCYKNLRTDEIRYDDPLR